MYHTFDRTDKKDSLTSRVANIYHNEEVQAKLKACGLKAQAVAWEDTSRTKNSCWGSNISDLTLRVDKTRMPIIRAPNFEDCTVDLTMDKLPMLVVGNECGSELTKVTLKEYLEHFEKYCGCRTMESMNLFHERDTHVLTSAQACVLPIESNKAEFDVNLYNYQSYRSEPAILVLMSTAHGTSACVVCDDNNVLYFNDNGTSRLFKAERLTDYRVSQGRSTEGAMNAEEKALNGIYIFQIPLKIERARRFGGLDGGSGYKFASFELKDDSEDECAECDYGGLFGGDCDEEDLCYESMMIPVKGTERRRGMERAILSLGEEKGPYRGIMKDSSKPHKIVRDTDRPIRLTVQFYMCSDTDNVPETNILEISEQIRKIYDMGLNEGSLVVDHEVNKPGIKISDKKERPTATKKTSTPKILVSEETNIL